MEKKTFVELGHGDVVYTVNLEKEIIRERKLIGSKVSGPDKITLFFSETNISDWEVSKVASKDDTYLNLTLFLYKYEAIEYFESGILKKLKNMSDQLVSFKNALREEK